MNLTETINLLKLLISIPSLSKEEDKTGDAIEEKLTQLGFHPKRVKNNIWAYLSDFDSNKPTLLLNSHHDTVKPGENWTSSPFEPTEKDGKLIGLGSNDAGASLVCLLAAFNQLKENNLPFNLLYLASAEEEISGKNGVELAKQHIGKIDFAIVGEPTDCQVAVAEKGLLVLDGYAKGKTGHAARKDGKNAIYEALESIQTLKDFQFENVSDHLGPININITQIEGGWQHNVIPDTCHFVVDVRTTDAYKNQEVVDILNNAVKAELKPRSTRLNASGVAQDHLLFRATKKVNASVFASPTLSDQALMPWPSVKVGPGHSPRSHTPNEFIYLKEIEQGISFYKNYIEAIASLLN